LRKAYVLESAAICWIAVSIAFAVWEAVTYSGIYAAAAEWQFDELGQSFPAATVGVLVLVLGLPVLLARLWLRRRERLIQAHVSATRLAPRRPLPILRLMVLLSLASLIAAACLFVHLLLVEKHARQTSSPERRLSVGGQPTDGNASIYGRFRYDRTARLVKNAIVSHRTYYFTPIQTVGKSASEPLSFFVVGASKQDSRAIIENRSGFLKKVRLPGEIRSLYRDAGYSLSPTIYVLYADPTLIYWTIAAEIGQLLVFSILLALASWFLYRRLRKAPARAQLLLTSQ